MKQVVYWKLNKSTFLSALFFSLFLSFTSSLAQGEGDPQKGKALFNTNCAACHHLDRRMVGPALRNMEQRLSEEEGLDRVWLYSWIRNSSALIKAGDSYAVKVYEEYGKTAMTPFPQLSDEDLNNILAYTAQEQVAPVSQVLESQVGGNQDDDSRISERVVLGGLVILFALLAYAFFIVNATLRKLAASQNISLPETSGTPLWVAFVKNQFLVLVSSIILLLLAAYFAYGYMMQLGIDQGYQPVQPIHYSHKIHAGDNKIDCKYCHSSARTSKTAGIPSLNVCMNCHKSIFEVAPSTATPEYSKEFYDEQIKALYRAVGWDEKTQRYTGETNPVKWIRIHNLPDFAYFNHSQHVNVAGLECQTCHGPVEEMEVMSQFAPLTMGWCIDCHRTTNVKVEDNEYYKKVHKELTEKYGIKELTAAQMGGLECGKCHY